MTAEPHGASAAPRVQRGTRTRAGNAMARTRAALLDGAVRAVEKHGVRRVTMADVAALSGVAKATLYNHFRAKDAVLAAAADAAVRDLAAECAAVAADEGVEAALTVAAERVSGSAALRRVAAEEPAVACALAAPGDAGVWTAAREGVAAMLAAGGCRADEAAVDVVLRWLASHVCAPAAAAGPAAAVLAAGLRR